MVYCDYYEFQNSNAYVVKSLIPHLVYHVTGRKMRVYSSDSVSDDSLNSPVLECDYLFPGSFESFIEGELGLVGSTVPTSQSSSSLLDLDEELSLPSVSTPSPLASDPPTENAPLEEKASEGGIEEEEMGDSGPLLGSAFLVGSTLPHAHTHPMPLPRSRTSDHERRRFSASELISRLQLSQRKNSFTLRLGKSLSARVASRDRHQSVNSGPDCECFKTSHISIPN